MSAITEMRRRRRNGGQVAKTVGLVSNRPKSGGCLDTTLTEKIALRPNMRELCSLLCDSILNHAQSAVCAAKNKKGEAKKISPSPRGEGAANQGAGRIIVVEWEM